jgi:hypothetical protein
MPGRSGRVVLEIDPEVKRRLYGKLAHEGRTLKAWFLERAEAYLAGDSSVQLELRQVNDATEPKRK